MVYDHACGPEIFIQHPMQMESNRWKLNIKVVSGLVCIIFPIYFSLFF